MVDDPLDGDPLALEEQVCFALSVAARSVVAVYRPLLEPMGLTHPQYLVMLALWQHAPLSVSELSRLLQLDPGTLSPLLKRLEAAGYLRRERDRRRRAQPRRDAHRQRAGAAGAAPSRSRRSCAARAAAGGAARPARGADRVIAAANGAWRRPAARRVGTRRRAASTPHGRGDDQPGAGRQPQICGTGGDRVQASA